MEHHCRNLCKGKVLPQMRINILYYRIHHCSDFFIIILGCLEKRFCGSKILFQKGFRRSIFQPDIQKKCTNTVIGAGRKRQYIHGCCKTGTHFKMELHKGTFIPIQKLSPGRTKKLSVSRYQSLLQCLV